MHRTTLSDDVSAAFDRACREQDFATAEHLLKAVEAIAERDGQTVRVDHAYRELVRAMPSSRPTGEH